MAKHSVYSIGRSRDADIQLSDSTISRNHAELVITAAGKYYLIDCASSGGTFVVKGNEKTAIKQAFVSQTDNLSFGEFHTSLQQLLTMIEDGGSGAGKKGRGASQPSPQDDLPSGPVRRDPGSGEILGDK